MRKAADLLFYEKSPIRLRDPHFVLTLESQMLFPEFKEDGITPSYAISLALHAGAYLDPLEAHFVDDSPSRWEASNYGPGELRRPQYFPNRSPFESRVDNLLFFPRHLNWESYESSKQLQIGKFDIDLQKIETLRPYRIAIGQSESSRIASRDKIRLGAWAGYISAIYLDMRRLLAGGTFKTKTGRTAGPSKNIVEFVLGQYNLGRKRRRSGRPEEENDEYPNINEQLINKIWGEYEENAALWAAYRALSPHALDAVPQKHLLQGFDADEFFRLFMAYESERRALDSDEAVQPNLAIGPQSHYDELRRVLDEHVPTYGVSK